MRLNGRRILVTGGGRGIGRAYVERFLREGARVHVGDLDTESAQRTVEELGALGPLTQSRVDVSNPTSVDELLATAADRMGGLDVLVNNAALLADWDRDDHSFENLARVFAVNLHSVWLMSRAAAPMLVESGSGRIINQASTAAYNYAYPAADEFTGLDSFSYGQSKHGVIGLTKLSAGQLGRFGVTVNCLAPGVVRTPALAKVPSEQLDRIEASQAVPGAIHPEDLTGAAVFFASEETRFVTGQVLVVDGGRFMPA